MDRGNLPAVADQCFVIQVFCCCKAQKTCVVFQRTQHPGLIYGLRGPSADTANAHEGHIQNSVGTIHFFSRQTQDWLEQADARIANCKLSCVYADGKAACSGSDVIARKSSLPPLIQFAVGVESERMRRNRCPGLENLPNSGVQIPHAVSIETFTLHVSQKWPARSSK